MGIKWAISPNNETGTNRGELTKVIRERTKIASSHYPGTQRGVRLLKQVPQTLLDPAQGAGSEVLGVLHLPHVDITGQAGTALTLTRSILSIPMSSLAW